MFRKGNNVIGFEFFRRLLCLQCRVWNSVVQERKTESYDHNPVRDDRSLDWNGSIKGKRDEGKLKKYLGGRIIRILLGDAT